MRLDEYWCRDRRRRLLERIDPSVDLVVVSTPWHIHYLADYWIDPNSLNAAGLAFLILERDGATTLFADNHAAEIAESAFVDRTETAIWYAPDRPIRNRLAATAEDFAAWLTRRRPRRVAAESAHLPWTAAEALRNAGADIVDVVPVLEAMRRSKDPDEIALLRRAVEAACVGMERAREVIAPGVNEHDVYSEAHAAVVRQLGEPFSPVGDYVSDRRISGPPRNRKLAAGDLLIVDYSPLTRGYRADIANTFCTTEPTSAREKTMGVLLDVLAEVEKTLAPGRTGREIHAAMAEKFREAGVAEHFLTHAGHSLGLLHPEGPFFVPSCDEPLAANQVVTLEPGLYDPAVGSLRIEDDYLVTERGAERLSTHRKGF